MNNGSNGGIISNTAQIGRPEHEFSEEVQTIWGRRRADGASAADVYREIRKRHGREVIKERTVRKIVAKAKKKADEQGSAFQPVDWKPWQTPVDYAGDGRWNPPMSAEDAQFLLRISIAVQTVSQRPLRHHEALWAIRLRPALQGIDDLFSAWFVIEEYGKREETAVNLGQDEAVTSDLDSMLAFRPWAEEARDAYAVALETGDLPYPFIGALMVRDGEYQIGSQLLALRTAKALGLNFHALEISQEDDTVTAYRLLPEKDGPSPDEGLDRSWGELLAAYLKARAATK
ncbi:MAG: hypothetical protein O3C10_01840 [Chloroflexi bacterium]|nr:hypothetical protein [Chloroflexota bacterium]